MAYEVRLSRRALRDLDRIYRYVQADKSIQASVWYAKLEEAIFSLERYPGRTPVISEDHRLRHLLYGKKPHIHRVIYEIDRHNRIVDVLHIRHGRRKRMSE